jgi:sporulation protein YlmC with PRC-barrel domain
LIPSGSIRFNQQVPSLMKTLCLFGATLAILGVVVVPISAQTQSTTVQVSKLVGTKVKSSQGEEIGVIKDVMIDRSTGCMAYTVLSTGDGGETRAAGGGKLVAVPWAVYSPASDVNVLTVTVDRGRIYSAPVFDYARIDEYSRSDYITNVYGYYGVSSGAEVGTSRTTTTGATTEATSGARAAGSPPAGGVSPAAKPSPAATRSPVERESPAGKASPRPHATASPHARGEASATPSSRRAPEETESPSSRTKEGRGTKARPEETEPPSGGAELQREPSEATRESPSDATNSGDKTSEGNQKRPHRKPERREANTPPPEGGAEQR